MLASALDIVLTYIGVRTNERERARETPEDRLEDVKRCAESCVDAGACRVCVKCSRSVIGALF